MSCSPPKDACARCGANVRTHAWSPVSTSRIVDGFLLADLVVATPNVYSANISVAWADALRSDDSLLLRALSKYMKCYDQLRTEMSASGGARRDGSRRSGGRDLLSTLRSQLTQHQRKLLFYLIPLR